MRKIFLIGLAMIPVGIFFGVPAFARYEAERTSIQEVTHSNSVPYKKALKRWTRKDTFYGHDDFFAKLAWKATYFSDPYLKARLIEYSKLFGLDYRGEQSYWRGELDEYQQAPTFFVAFYTQERQWNKLDSDTEALWRLSLTQGKSRCEASKITRLGKLDAEERFFFPYVEQWDVAYLVSFPSTCRPDEDEAFRLSIRGLYGHSELTWSSNNRVLRKRQEIGIVDGGVQAAAFFAPER